MPRPPRSALHSCFSECQLVTAPSWRWTQSHANPAPPAFSLLTGKNTGNFAFSGASNCALLLGNPHPEPISSHCTCFRRISEQGINRERIRELTGAQQRKNRELL